MKRVMLISVFSVAGAIAAWWAWRPGTEGGAGQTPVVGDTIVAVSMPELSGMARPGATAFAGLCAHCHGANAGGIEGKGPPLIHKVYEPGHHGDFSIVRAVRLGVRSHHWQFGDMPPVEGATDADIKAIIAFIRTVQNANGIN